MSDPSDLEATLNIIRVFQESGIYSVVEPIKEVVDVLGYAKGFQFLSNQSYIRRVAYFCKELENIPQKKREAFAREMNNPKKSKRVGAAILSIFERANRDEKATIAGKVFHAYISRIELPESSQNQKTQGERKLTSAEFDRIMNAIETIHSEDLNDFAIWVLNQIPHTGKRSIPRTSESFDESRMMQAGFVSLRLAPTASGNAYGVSEKELRYEITPLGRAFAKILVSPTNNS